MTPRRQKKPQAAVLVERERAACAALLEKLAKRLWSDGTTALALSLAAARIRLRSKGGA